MDGSNEPAEPDLRHNEVYAFKGERFPALIIQQEEDSSENLNNKQEQGNAAEIIPHRMAMNRNPAG